MSIQAVLFDAYGTLFDVYSVTESAEARFPGFGAALAQQWRVSQIDYTRLYTLSGRYKPFFEITRDALRFAFKRLGLKTSRGDEDDLMSEYDCLKPFAENRGVLQSLTARGIPAGVLSNGDPRMLNAAVASAGFTEYLQHLLSVDAVRQFKTAPAAYALGPAACGVRADEILFVSSNCWDACCAGWYGYKTLWVNRAGLPLEELDATPDWQGAELGSVFDALAHLGR